MKILLYLLSLRWGLFLSKPKKILPLIISILLLLVLFANVAGFGQILNYLAEKQHGPDVAGLVVYIPVIVFFIPVVLLFVPAYSPRASLFTPYDPIDRLSKVTIEILYHFLSSRYLILAACLGCLFAIATPFPFSGLLLSLTVLFASAIACLIVQTLLSPELFLPLRVPLTIVFLLASGYLLLVTGSTARVGAGVILCYWIIAYGLQFISSRPVERYARSARTSGNLFTMLLSAGLRTGALRINLVIAILFKIIFLSFFVKAAQNKPGVFPIYMEYFLLSSLLVFTYVFNNTWGYLKTIYLNLAQQRDFFILFKCYLLLLVVPMIADVVLSLGFAIAGRVSLIAFAEFYLLSLPANILIGFYASLRQPFEVAKAIDLVRFRSNTSLGSNLLSMLSTCLCGLLTMTGSTNPLLLPAAIVYLVLIAWLYYSLIGKRKTEIYIKFPYHLFTPKS